MPLNFKEENSYNFDLDTGLFSDFFGNLKFDNPFSNAESTSIAEPGSQLSKVLGSAKQLGQEAKEKIGEPLLKGIKKFGEKTMDVLTSDPLNPGTSYIDPALQKLGTGPGFAFGIGLGIDYILPGPGEILKINKLAKEYKAIPDLINESKALEDIASRAKTGEKLLPDDVSFLKQHGIELKGKPVKELDKTFQGLPNLSTKLLEKFKGMPEEITQQQFNEVINKATKEGIRKADLDIINSSLVRSGDKINLSKIAAKVEEQLVPLTPTPVKSPRWSNIGENFIGNGKYGEVVYQSPIKTSAGDVHFRSYGEGTAASRRFGKDNFPNYFSHIRYEDLVDGRTRKILETQSDLFQKENFAEEIDVGLPESIQQLNRRNDLAGKPLTAGFTKKQLEIWNKNQERLSNLQPYSSNDPLAQLRTFREEVKRAAKDGKDTLLIPSGETAMKIENLWKDKVFRIAEQYPNKLGGRTIPNMDTAKVLTKNDIRYGTEIHMGSTGQMSHDTIVIIEDRGNGAFRAVPGKIWEEAKKWNEGIEKKSFLNNRAENYDLFNKDLESHFVYKLNEEAIPREARRMGLEVIGKIKEGAGEYWKIKIGKERSKMPIDAFGGAKIKTIIGVSGGTIAGGIIGTLSIPTINKQETEWSKNLAEDVKNSFPFEEIAKGKLQDVKYNEYYPKDKNEQGVYSQKGQEIYDRVRRIAPSLIAEFIADVGRGITTPNISVSKDMIDPLKQVMAHEMLHHLYSFKYGNDSLNRIISQQLENDFLNSWNSIAGKYPELIKIDRHIKKNKYDTTNNKILSTERFSYLGEKALYHGIGAIPKELRIFYKDIIKQ